MARRSRSCPTSASASPAIPGPARGRAAYPDQRARWHRRRRCLRSTSAIASIRARSDARLARRPEHGITSSLASGANVARDRRSPRSQPDRVGGGCRSSRSATALRWRGRLPEPEAAERWPDDRVVLLGQLIGDGSYLKHAPMRYTTASEENSARSRHAATREFGAKVTRYSGSGSLAPAPDLRQRQHGGTRRASAHGSRSSGSSGSDRTRSGFPRQSSGWPTSRSRLLLRHLWATDGCIWSGITAERKTRSRRVYLRDGESRARRRRCRAAVAARDRRPDRAVKSGDGRRLEPWSSREPTQQRRFLDAVGAFGPARAAGQRPRTRAAAGREPNVDTLPIEIWDDRQSRRWPSEDVSHRAMAMSARYGVRRQRAFRVRAIASDGRELRPTAWTRRSLPLAARIRRLLGSGRRDQRLTARKTCSTSPFPARLLACGRHGLSQLGPDRAGR